MPLSLLTALDVGLGILFLAILLGLVSRKTSNMPPGPRGLPLLGNVLDMPTTYPWLTFAEWAKKYGIVFAKYLLSYPH